jgi:hypothetical protein
MVFDLTMMIYWLLLAAWFGLVLFGAMATPSIFRTVQDADPTLPTVLSVNLDGQHGTLLSMTIVLQMLQRLVNVQLVCAIGLALSLGAQWALTSGNGQAVVMTAIRSALFLAAVGLLVYGWRMVWPRLASQRKHYIEHADDPEQADAARDQLVRLQRESDIVQVALAAVLSALVLFSATVSKPLGERVLAGG